MTGKQDIRRSQFIFTYGPGSLLESRKACSIMPSMGRGLHSNLTVAKELLSNEIEDARLGDALRLLLNKTNNVRLLKIPSKDECKSLKEYERIYMTWAFPSWHICNGRDRPGVHNYSIIFDAYLNKSKCPKCGTNKGLYQSRYVMICLNGHLDDVNWHQVLHESGECNPKYYIWEPGGSTLKDIRITCPDCGATKTMAEIYSTDFPCSGRSPENEIQSLSKSPSGLNFSEPYQAGGCDAEMRVIQRQANSIRIAQTQVLLTIPEYDKPFITTIAKLGKSDVVAEYISNWDSKKKGAMTYPNVREYVADNVDQLTETIKMDDENLTSVRRYLTRKKGTGGKGGVLKFLDYISEEFESLSKVPDQSPNFRMIKTPNVYDLPIEYGPVRLNAFKIERIRTVTAQFAYQRIPALKTSTDSSSRKPRDVDVSSRFLGGEPSWYPGFEGFGEAIFLVASDPKKLSSIIDAMVSSEEWKLPMTKELSDFRSSYWLEVMDNPIFVWWHTLSHCLIRALGSYSGYSSASLRERVYCNPTENEGGVLIYTTSPGQDASMGGLIETADNFNPILGEAIKQISNCSNDPLCSEIRKTSNRLNGSACYSCLFLSETSCEHRNMSLDRHMLLGD